MTQSGLTQNDFYFTTSLSLAAVLSLSYPIESIDKSNPAKATFIFRRDENLDQLVEGFWKQELRVEPQTYFNQLRSVKSRLYSER